MSREKKLTTYKDRQPNVLSCTLFSTDKIINTPKITEKNKNNTKQVELDRLYNRTKANRVKESDKQRNSWKRETTRKKSTAPSSFVVVLFELSGSPKLRATQKVRDKQVCVLTLTHSRWDVHVSSATTSTQANINPYMQELDVVFMHRWWRQKLFKRVEVDEHWLWW